MQSKYLILYRLFFIMSQSTPINMLRRGENNLPPPMDPSLQAGNMPQQLPSMMQQPSMHSDSQLVEDILKEMGESPGRTFGRFQARYSQKPKEQKRKGQ
mgnify:CR=1 FL=1